MSFFSLFARGGGSQRDFRSAASFPDLHFLLFTHSFFFLPSPLSSPSPTNHPTQQVKRVRCESSGVLVPKDKAVKRFIVRNIVDASAVRDLQVREARRRKGRARARAREREK